MCPEFIQGAAEPRRLAEAVRPLLGDTPERRVMLEGLESVCASLAGGKGMGRAAEIVLEELAKAAPATTNG